MSEEIKKLNLPKKLISDIGDWETINKINFWLRNSYYKRKLSSGFKRWSVKFGPPFTSGEPHLGTIYSQVIKDTLASMRWTIGYNVSIIPGFDCHGLATEKLAIKQFGNQSDISKHFNNCLITCRRNMLQQISIFSKFGLTVDWENVYITASNNYINFNLKNLRKLNKKGLLAEKMSVVKWCTSLSTIASISDLSTQNIKIKTCYYLFKVLKTELYIIVYTETPWSLPANNCIAYNNSIKYKLYKTKFKNNEIVIISSENIINKLSEFTFKEIDDSSHVLKRLDQIQYVSDFSNIPLRIFHADWVKNKNTGFVHVAGLYGKDDYELCITKNLPLLNLHSEFGYKYQDIMTKDIDEASNLILNKFINNVFVEKLEVINFDIFDRSGKRVIDYIANQWFLNTTNESIVRNQIQMINSINWVRDSSREYMINLVQKADDWCVSRNRLFNTPLIIDEKKIVTKDLRIELYKKGLSGLDVWLDSANSFQYCYRNNPVDLSIEGLDQYRGYFLQSIRLHSMLGINPPFKKVIVTGFIVDKDGNKLSKSLKNYESINKLLEIYHPDSIRIFAAKNKFFDDVKVSNETLNISHRINMKIRNFLSYLLFYDLQESIEMPLILLEDFDKWILVEAKLAWIDYIRAVKNDNPNKALSVALNLLNKSSELYIQASKEILYKVSEETRHRYLRIVTVIKQLLKIFIRMFTPFTPILIQEIMNNKLSDIWERNDLSFMSKILFLDTYKTLEESLEIVYSIRSEFESLNLNLAISKIAIMLPLNMKKHSYMITKLITKNIKFNDDIDNFKILA